MKFRPTLTDQIIEEKQVQIKNQGLEKRNLCDTCREDFVELIKPQEVGQSHLDRMKQNQEITQHFTSYEAFEENWVSTYVKDSYYR